MNERGLWKLGISVCGCPMSGTWREGSLTGDPEGYSKALEMGPVLGNMRGCSFPRAFERGVKFLFLLGEFYEEFARYANGQLSP